MSACRQNSFYKKKNVMYLIMIFFGYGTESVTVPVPGPGILICIYLFFYLLASCFLFIVICHLMSFIYDFCSASVPSQERKEPIG